VTAAQEIHKIEFEIPPHRQLEKEAVSLESVYLSSYAFAGTKNYLFPLYNRNYLAVLKHVLWLGQLALERELLLNEGMPPLPLCLPLHSGSLIGTFYLDIYGIYWLALGSHHLMLAESVLYALKRKDSLYTIYKSSEAIGSATSTPSSAHAATENVIFR